MMPLTTQTSHTSNVRGGTCMIANPSMRALEKTALIACTLNVIQKDGTSATTKIGSVCETYTVVTEIL